MLVPRLLRICTDKAVRLVFIFSFLVLHSNCFEQLEISVILNAGNLLIGDFICNLLAVI
jgi:hypothetical protein